MSTTKIELKETVSLELAVCALEAFVASFGDRSVPLEWQGRSLELEPSGVIDVKIKASQHGAGPGAEQKIRLVLTWDKAQPPQEFLLRSRPPQATAQPPYTLDELAAESLAKILDAVNSALVQ